jgi:alkanesulfonate monooxygenase SsuD/methylene tetrahydromethanopterin reductase-like flavin-dependent oxidoreductase (luciferase family)
MQFGFVMPVGNAQQIMEAAVVAERHGWDGFFVWEPVWGVDAWVAMTAAVVATSTIKLGTLLSPLSRMRPWQVAAKSATLDHLSKGRLILSVGLGATDTGFEQFGEVTGVRERAELLDESLDIITGLWGGQPFVYTGKHYQISESTFPHKPPPCHNQRVPIWVVGLWPNKRSMARAVKYQGILPSVRDEHQGFRRLTHEDVSAVRNHTGPGVDIIVEGEEGKGSPGQSMNWKDAGATWYIESLWETQFESDIQERVTTKLKGGPPI